MKNKMVIFSALTLCLALTMQNAAATTPPLIPPCEQGRMTGGGSILPETGRVTHGFELHCDPTALPNNLEVNWGPKTSEMHFHLQSLTSAYCYYDTSIGSPNPPKASFNTFVGTGTGSLNGVDGATISFTFTDTSQPGVNDIAMYVISDSSGNVVLDAQGYLTKGAQQAHK